MSKFNGLHIRVKVFLGLYIHPHIKLMDRQNIFKDILYPHSLEKCKYLHIFTTVCIRQC